MSIQCKYSKHKAKSKTVYHLCLTLTERRYGTYLPCIATIGLTSGRVITRTSTSITGVTWVILGIFLFSV